VTQSPETEKLSTYECGFEPYEDSRNSVRFYIVAILFILFDIEIIFLLPWCVSTTVNLLTWSMIEFSRTWYRVSLCLEVGAIEWD
jgi:NADH-quinone oxidoreductase subunit A